MVSVAILVQDKVATPYTQVNLICIYSSHSHATSDSRTQQGKQGMITDHTDEAMVSHPSSNWAHSYLTSMINCRLLAPSYQGFSTAPDELFVQRINHLILLLTRVTISYPPFYCIWYRGGVGRCLIRSINNPQRLINHSPGLLG